MAGKRKLYISAALALVIVGGVGGIFLFAGPQTDRAFDEFEVRGSVFRVRVSAYHDSQPLTLPGARYVFRSASVDSDKWKEILVYKADQPVSLRDGHIRFVQDRIAYAFVDNYYMVTTDGGQEWFVWDANKQLPVEELKRRYNLWPAITGVEMSPDGRGSMTLVSFLSNRTPKPKLSTSDYGHHWSIAALP
jgi:hypothetical protein